ncbi:MAG: molecular chaperone HtpG [Porticoccaceae bacterium]|nr:molecular chaperone HtpG [Porticoccaceae bacterium]
MRFESLKQPDLMEGDAEPVIRLSVDEAEGTITLSDNGIGMSREEVIDNLGTIARSGTAKFMEALSGDEKKDAQLIGQFGVGFYSSFIVADKVVVQTRRAGLSTAEGVQWTCTGEDEFTIETIDKPERGTRITLHLKEEDKGFANTWRLRSIINKYSDHIAIPIQMPASKADDEESGGEEWETINDATALWMRPRNEISDEDYKQFYQHVAHDFREPLTWSHNRVEGKYDYTSLLYIPSEAPFDLYQREAPRGVKLYVQRTFIMDDAEQFLPLYLRFVKGIVDSSDLPLNVSRELLQDSPAVSGIRSALTKRVLDMLNSLATEKPDDYLTFWKAFGSVLKEGLAEDFGNKERIAELLRFASTAAEEGQLVSLADYVNRMKSEQSKIYYLIAENREAALGSPYLEVFKKHNIEVLLLTDRIDEWMMSYLHEFDGKSLQNIAKGDLNLEGITDQGDETDSPEATDGSTDADSGLAEKIKGILGDAVADVKVSRRLTDSPACLVVGEQDLGVQMRRILEAAGQSVPDSKPTLEINPSHPLMTALTGSDEEKSRDLAWVIYRQAILLSGDDIDNPSEFVQQLNRLLVS